MRIIAHRGLWKTETEKNTLIAFERAFSFGYGIETDIRDRNGTIVLSHNPPDESCPLFTDLLDLWIQYTDRPLLALNIKSDGLYLLLEDIFKKYELTKDDYFFFDASVPEQYVYLKRRYQMFSRSSEFEEIIPLYEQCSGIWLDQFTDCNHIENNIKMLLASGKTISVVSPELHNRGHMQIWKILKKYRENNNLILCTDVPEEAEEYFNEKDKSCDI